MKDRHGRNWPYPQSELCPTCRQPDTNGDCNHIKLSDFEALQVVYGVDHPIIINAESDLMEILDLLGYNKE